MTENSIIPPEFVPSVSEYVAAFKKIKDKMNDKQRELLRNHHDFPCSCGNRDGTWPFSRICRLQGYQFPVWQAGRHAG